MREWQNWKTPVVIGAGFFVIAAISAAIMTAAGESSWRWLFPVAWAILGIAQFVSARRKYVAARRAGSDTEQHHP